ncbi:uncharacterized protein At5g39865-like [Salvia hispanica]|uniref:uncharacterized protein At5g39865-like n=1 Tax=Salvia hispanica TaxID=49212 RepID=UPI0020091575|nr:uncharacterized protein At5g39865-like [Salvia hispanica]
MKAMKGKLLKKLKTVKAIGYLKPDTILEVSGYLHTSARPPLAAIEECPNSTDDKENVSPEENENVAESKPQIGATSFRRPDLYSGSLFDPNLLAAFEQAVMEVKAREAERRKRIEEDGEEEPPPSKSRRIDPLAGFEERCPPGGGESVVLYTTGLRAIRETFEDCQKTRSLLENLRVVFLERDVSMHCEYKEEMWRILGGKIAPPRLFIKGRYIGGAEEVIGLHEQGRLKPLMQGIPVDDGRRGCCEGCVGLRFIVCFNCDGSRKIMPEGDGEAIVCNECNENGLIVCPFCC